tara:strand:- start:4157 stop:4729 length:573 start_codon:yes stop_codon:yes gene_type:complete
MIKDIYRVPILEAKLVNNELKNHFINILENCKKNNNLSQLSNCGGYQTPSINGSVYNTAFKEAINTYITSFKRRIDFEWTINGLWVNQNWKFNFNRPHTHLAEYNHYSGIWYLKVPNKSGNLVFFTRPDNSDCTHTWDYIDDMSAGTNYVVCPEDNAFLLFPSHLTHMVEPNQSDEDRISVAFNIGLKKI